jgi:hypothetical protein
MPRYVPRARDDLLNSATESPKTTQLRSRHAHARMDQCSNRGTSSHQSSLLLTARQGHGLAVELAARG